MGVSVGEQHQEINDGLTGGMGITMHMDADRKVAARGALRRYDLLACMTAASVSASASGPGGLGSRSTRVRSTSNIDGAVVVDATGLSKALTRRSILLFLYWYVNTSRYIMPS